MKKTMRRAHMSAVKRTSHIKPLALAITMVAASQQAHALSFEYDDINIEWDSTFTYGIQFRAQDRDPTISTTSDGVSDNKMDIMPTVIDNAFLLNGNDGNNNFDKGDITSNRLSLLTEIDINTGNVGLFARAKIYYDGVYDLNKTSIDSDAYYSYNGRERFHTKGPTPYTTGEQGQFVDGARDYLKSGARFLDVFVYGTWDLNEEQSLSWRVGRQVISWGEALMTGGNITTAINRIDAQIRGVPGLELKELFLPTGAVFGSINLNDSWNLAAYYQYEWNANILDPVSSYGSEFDSIGAGGDTFLFVSGEEEGIFGWELDGNKYTEDDPTSFRYKGYKKDADQLNRFLPYEGCPEGENQRCSTLTPYKLREETPSDQGQFGLSLKHFLENGDELGLYFANYHERIPNFVLPLNVANEYAILLDVVLKYTDYANYQRQWVDKGGYQDISDLGKEMSPRQLNALLDFFTALPGEGGTVTEIVNNFIPIYLETMGVPGAGLVFDGLKKILGTNPLTSDLLQLSLTVLSGTGALGSVVCPESKCVLPDETLEILNSDTFIDALNYRLRYYDNIRLWGATYSTVVGDANVAGEITYRENAPIMRGDVARTADRQEVIQINTNAIFVFEPAKIGNFKLWDFSSFTAEFAGWYLPGRKNFDINDMLNPDRLAVQNSARGFGYAFLWTLEHKGVTEGLDLTFPIYVNHGVEGAMFTTGFRQGQITTAVGVTAKYLDALEFSVSYMTNFGDKDDLFQTLTHDRDNISLAFKYGF